ncbi:MAG: endonuclease/exonuclease/phosphatase family protein [Bacteroidales bacterium]|nr:endonuclease/exonuclease/phosphatase family protein [Bacteroidales bacterium]
MVLLFQIISLFTLAATLTSLLLSKAWWIRMFDFPRVQIMVLMLLGVAGLFVFSDVTHGLNVVLIFLVLAAFIVQFSYIFPYLPIARKEMSDGQNDGATSISLLMSNVLMENRDAEKLIHLVRHYQPDIFLAVETDAWWADKLQVLENSFEFSVKHPLENTYGMVLFSKLPLENVHVEHLIQNDVPSIHADVTKDHFAFKLACIHPEPPAPQHSATSKPRDRELMLMAKKTNWNASPYIVIGDLNDVAWSDTSSRFAKLSGLRDPRKGRGFFNTFHAKIPFMRFVLDHAFFSHHFKVIALKRLPGINSDHFSALCSMQSVGSLTIPK